MKRATKSRILIGIGILMFYLLIGKAETDSKAEKNAECTGNCTNCEKVASNSDDYILYQLRDPLRLPKISPRYYYQVIKMIHNLKNVKIEDVGPTCVFFGGNDYLVSFDAVKEFVKRLKNKNKALSEAEILNRFKNYLEKSLNIKISGNFN